MYTSNLIIPLIMCNDGIQKQFRDFLFFIFIEFVEFYQTHPNPHTTF